MKHNTISPLNPSRRSGAFFRLLRSSFPSSSPSRRSARQWGPPGPTRDSCGAAARPIPAPVISSSLSGMRPAAGHNRAACAINSVSVANGLFTVALDFRDQLFFGEARWLGTSVQCSGDGGFTPLDPRQPITATPYALSLRPGAAYRFHIGLRPPALKLRATHRAEVAAVSGMAWIQCTGSRGVLHWHSMVRR